MKKTYLRCKFLCYFFVASLAGCTTTHPTASLHPQLQTREYSASTLIIFYDAKAGDTELLNAVKKYKATVIYEYKNFNGIAISLPKGSVLEDAITYFSNVKGVIAVNKDYINHLD